MTIKSKNLALQIATLNLPTNSKMPGTIASCIVWSYFNGICALNLMHNHGLNKWFLESYGLWVPVVAFVIALPIINCALKFFAQKDPVQICLDEVVGMLVSMCLLPINFLNSLLALVLFRFFDVVKPLGIKKVEQLPDAWGVLLDDVLAGIYANITLRLLILIFVKLFVFFD